ncbi:MAG: ATP-binding cassette domain-containing protein, partial [Planctomycetaceae bacterium]
MTDVIWTLDRVRLGRSPSPRLDDVSLAVAAGITAVVGYSGAGKTSLLNLLVGYERPDAGVVMRRSRSLSDGVRRLPVFWVPPDDGLWSRVSVRRHFELVLP